MPFLTVRRRVRGPGLQGGRPPCCRPGALTGRCERASARMKAATLPPLGGYGVSKWRDRLAQGQPGKGHSGPGIAGGNHEVMEMDCRRREHGQLDPRFQAPRPEKCRK